MHTIQLTPEQFQALQIRPSGILMQFHKGQRVIALNDKPGHLDMRPTLIKGRAYTITDIDGAFIRVDGCIWWFIPNFAFTPAPTIYRRH